MRDPARSSSTPVPLALVATGVLALLVRVLHNQALLADPLYFNPLGGNLPLLIAAEAIAGGDLVPFDGPISLNSPLYPYLLAGLYEVFGTNAFWEVRLVGALADGLTCVLLARLAWRHFGTTAAWATGVAAAVYGPLIFFSTDLNPVPFVLLLLVTALSILDGASEGWAEYARWAAAGLALGLATALRPNVLLAVAFALPLPWLRVRRAEGPAVAPRTRAAMAGALLAGAALGIAPVTAINAAASGTFVPLTTGGGHNLFIGHNPEARAQYSLPAALDGDIFQTMKALAEEVEGRPLEDGEVSSWYTRRAIEHVVANPGRELQLAGRRLLLLANDAEPTTYANPEYQAWYSSVLRWSPGFALLLVLAVPGLPAMLRRERAHLWLPLVAGVVVTLLFFHIARLRILLVPTLLISVGAGAAWCAAAWRDRRTGALATRAAVAVCAGLVALLPLLEGDTSNEWNKAAGIYRRDGFAEEAEAALRRAEAANPANPDTWRNRAALYRDLGRSEEAAEAEATAEALAAGGGDDLARYREGLGGAR